MTGSLDRMRGRRRRRRRWTRWRMCKGAVRSNNRMMIPGLKRGRQGRGRGGGGGGGGGEAGKKSYHVSSAIY
jgi:hypothetical protein